MKNPLIKRIPRELRQNMGKYLALFIFMTLFIGMVSGFLVADLGYEKVYNNAFAENKIEDGHFSFDKQAPDELIEELAKEGGVSIYSYFYFEEEIKDTDKNIRVYSTKRELNILALMEGEMPSAENEIALDRVFAQQNEINVGDEIILKDKTLIVSGYIASPDYSTLFENNSDSMYNATSFSVAAMTQEGFDSFDSANITYNYAWLFPQFVERTDTETAKRLSDDFIDVFEDVVTEYNTGLYVSGNTELIEVNDLLPRYLNQAINFIGADMSGDKVMFTVFDYILTVVLAFVFAITVSNTIKREASVIGTLRASGYTRGELLSHYIVLPVLVTFISAVLGNILGYTLFFDYFASIYYEMASLTAFEIVFSLEAFLLTTVIPIVIMLLINILVISGKLKLSPLRLIRRDLSRSRRKKAVRLNTKIPFIQRFRLRIIIQNIPDYITLFFGILIGGVLVVFGTMFVPMMDNSKELSVNDRICDYQYILTEQVETMDTQAEKYAATTLKTTDENKIEDEISIFGIENNSCYVEADIADGRLAVSHNIAEKYNLKEGDTFTLKDSFNNKKLYDFEVGTIYEYNTGLAIFMTKSDYCELFGESADYFTGYFSDTELSDVYDDSIYTVITVSDMTKSAEQLTDALGSFMEIFKWLGVIIFILLMYIMSKQIIEKNTNSVSMSKILGFTSGEIGGLYITATSVAVVVSLLLTMPLVGEIIKVLFDILIYDKMSGYFPFMIPLSSYIQMFALGIISYAVVAIALMTKINRIPKSDALKNVE